MKPGGGDGGAGCLAAAGGEGVKEAREVGDVEDRGRGGVVAVGVGVAGGEGIKEAGEVGDVENRGCGGGIAGGVAGGGDGADAGEGDEVPAGVVAAAIPGSDGLGGGGPVGLAFFVVGGVEPDLLAGEVAGGVLVPGGDGEEVEAVSWDELGGEVGPVAG